MKHLLLATLLLLASTALGSTAQKDTPASILVDYLVKSANALAKLNLTLESKASAICHGLDADVASKIDAQVKSKQAGRFVSTPRKEIADVFALYDAARAQSLKPIQIECIGRIDVLLDPSKAPMPFETVTGKPKKTSVPFEIINGLTKVRAEITSGILPFHAKMPVYWTYHETLMSKAEGQAKFSPNGQFEMVAGSNRTTGHWKSSLEIDKLEIDISGSKVVWVVQVEDKVALVYRPGSGPFFLKVVK